MKTIVDICLSVAECPTTQPSQAHQLAKHLSQTLPYDALCGASSVSKDSMYHQTFFSLATFVANPQCISPSLGRLLSLAPIMLKKSRKLDLIRNSSVSFGILVNLSVLIMGSFFYKSTSCNAKYVLSSYVQVISISLALGVLSEAFFTSFVLNITYTKIEKISNYLETI